MVRLLFPEDGYFFDTHTDIQNTFIDLIHMQGTDAALAWLGPVKNNCECTYPRALTFTWLPDGAPEYRLELAEDVDFTNAHLIVTRDDRAEVDTLKIGRRYFWRVNGSAARWFETDSAVPRFIRIDGVPNVRDMGGGKIRQGILYRGGAMDGKYAITEAGKRIFREVLGIRTQIELRKEMLGKLDCSPAGADVQLAVLPYRPYREVFEDEHRQGICRIMGFLADESNYPIYFHCRGGADRTGMIALYLRALVGETDDEIHTDYELTGLSAYAAGESEGADGFRRRTAPYYAEFLKNLSAYAPGRPICDAARAFLLDCGVKEEHMRRIVEIIGV